MILFYSSFEVNKTILLIKFAVIRHGMARRNAGRNAWGKARMAPAWQDIYTI
jgi:hypothetical protein